ncbi:MAG: histidinol-phosphate transaminase [Victivallales bacterium]|nr:histidinol-phosphate transaminase [Victivallales bacterium]
MKTDDISYFRPAIAAMSGYTPGEQPKVSNLIKLNTNENPYPPSPQVDEVLRQFAAGKLRLYPEPMADTLRDVIAALNGVSRENIIAGNGSDDILTIAVRSFCDAERPLACPDPTYSLYPALAEIQGAPCRRIALNDDFSLPEDLAAQAAGANLLLLARPNAPTGNLFPKEEIVRLCAAFDGMVLIDEAYVDFAADNCLDLAMNCPNVIVSRTMSKSYALAGARVGYAVSQSETIAGMMKVKDSYNLNMLTQRIAAAAFQDRAYLRQTVNRILATRARVAAELSRIGFAIIPSSTNFLFASPPDGDGGRYFELLRQNHIIVRYFPGARTGRYVRISIGSDADMDRVMAVTHQIYG